MVDIIFLRHRLPNEKGDTTFYFNTGLYNVDGKGAYPAYDQGLYQLNQK